jgi:hypothetical protein
MSNQSLTALDANKKQRKSNNQRKYRLKINAKWLASQSNRTRKENGSSEPVRT